MLGLWRKGLLASSTTLALAAIWGMLFAEEESTAVVPTMHLFIAADIGKSAINFFGTIGMVAKRRNTVTDEGIPVHIEPNGPAHYFHTFASTSSHDSTRRTAA